MYTPDASGRQNHGQVIGGVTPVDSPWGAGFGKAGSFDGSRAGNFPDAAGIDCGVVPIPQPSASSPDSSSNPRALVFKAVKGVSVVASPWGAGFGNAYLFDGVHRGDSTAGMQTEVISNAGITQFCLEVKVRRDRQNLTEVFAAWYSTAGSPWPTLMPDPAVCGMFFNTDNKLYAFFQGGGALTAAPLTATLGSLAVVPNGVHDVALSWDGATVRLYLDGVLQSSAAYSGTIGIERLTPLGIGRYPDWNGTGNTAGQDPYPFLGVIDEVRLSNVARYTGASYVPATVPFANDANTLALFHCDTTTRQAWTIEAFIQKTRDQIDVLLGWQDRTSTLSTGGAVPNTSLLLYIAAGKLVTAFNPDAGIAVTNPAQITLANGLHHVVYDFDGITQRVLIDGVLQSSVVAGTNAIPTLGNNTYRFMIGRDNDDGPASSGGANANVWPGATYRSNATAPYPFQGIIGPVRISSKVRYPGAAYVVPTQRFVNDDDTVGLWNMDTWITATTPDETGAHNGILVGEPRLVPSRWGSSTKRSMSFDGRQRREASQRVLVPGIWKAGSSFCVEARVLTPGPTLSTGPYQGIVAVWTGSPLADNDFLLYMNPFDTGSNPGSGNKIKFIALISAADATYGAVTSRFYARPATRYYLCMDWDNATKTLRFFIDGVLQGSVVKAAGITPAPSAYIAPAPPMVIGADGERTFGSNNAIDNLNSEIYYTANNAPAPFRGEIDEVRLSNISRHAASFIPDTAPFALDGNTDGLWRFDRIDRTIVSPVKVSDFARRADNGAVLAGAVARLFRDSDDGYIGQAVTAGDGSYTLCADPLEVAGGETYHVEFESADGLLYGKSKRGLVPA